MKGILKIIGKWLVVIFVFLLLLSYIDYKDDERLKERQIIEMRAYEAGYAEGYNDVYNFLAENAGYNYTAYWGVFGDDIAEILFEELEYDEAERIFDKMCTYAFVNLEVLEEQWAEYDDEYRIYKPANTIAE